ncbi:YdbL family protein [Croceicoccus bisphenolivorans]|uniref:YdbL family protein n=1 Tax=Croceicoccus bisphenolivorans TaxID=1783232 RepID=UPI000AC614A1|nr:YdbL family protein [Croceicoccus bisphenolivorans]
MTSTRQIVRKTAAALLAAGALAVVAAPAAAQGRDPAYAAARANGTIGEKMDGYLGFVGSPSPTLKQLVDDLNIRRKASYADRARSQGVTIEEFAFTQGCLLISRTVAGEKYQAPDGSWQTRGAGPARVDPRCPSAG